MKYLILAILAAGLAGPAHALDDQYLTLNAILEARDCKIIETGEQSCQFDFGPSLGFEIAGINKADAATLIYRANMDHGSGYYIKYGVLHGCWIISRIGNMFDVAFVSPVSANVYSTWQQCGAEFK